MMKHNNLQLVSGLPSLWGSIVASCDLRCLLHFCVPEMLLYVVLGNCLKCAVWVGGGEGEVSEQESTLVLHISDKTT